MVKAPGIEFYDPFSYDLELGVSSGRRPRREFYIDEANCIDGAILELGCGTGDITLAIARVGIEITGLDRSQAMLERCREKLLTEPESVRSRVRLVQGDMEELDLADSFDGIFIPYHALFHVLDATALDHTLRRIHDHLRVGGLLVLDVFLLAPGDMARLASSERLLRFVSEVETPKGACLVYQQSHYDPLTQRLTSTFRYELLDDQLHVADTWYRTLDYRVCTPEELRLRLELSGFQNVQVSAAFHPGARIEPGRDVVIRALRTAHVPTR